MILQEVHIDTVKPYIGNPRSNGEAVEIVKRSIETYGYLVPIIVNEDMEIVCGHTRHQALKALGRQFIPVIMAKLDDQQTAILRIADNKTAEIATWDKGLLQAELEVIQQAGIDLSNTGFSHEEIDLLMCGYEEEEYDAMDETIDRYSYQFSKDQLQEIERVVGIVKRKHKDKFTDKANKNPIGNAIFVMVEAASSWV